MWEEEIEDELVPLGEVASFSIEDEGTPFPSAAGEKQLHHVVHAERPTDLRVQVETPKRTQPYEVGGNTSTTAESA